MEHSVTITTHPGSSVTTSFRDFDQALAYMLDLICQRIPFTHTFS